MKALFAGSFDPFTIGHLDIARQALEIFDGLVIAVGYNEHKKEEFSLESRVLAIKNLFKDNPVVTVASYKGLTTEFAKKSGVDILVRGLRNTLDFEKEKELAEINREISGLPTVFLLTKPEYSFVSSSMVRELLHNGFDVSKYLPEDYSITLTEPKNR